MSHHQRVRRIRNFLHPYQRSQRAGWAAAFGPIAWETGFPGMQEVARGGWWCPASEGTPSPSGRNPWTSETVRGQRREGGCCRPSVLPPSGRIRPQRAPTVSRSTSPKPRHDSEHATSLLLFTAVMFWIFFEPLLFICYNTPPPFHKVLSSYIFTKQAMTAILVSWNLNHFNETEAYALNGI